MKYVIINGILQYHSKDPTDEDVINRRLLSYEMIISIVTIHYIDKKLSVIELEVKW